MSSYALITGANRGIGLSLVKQYLSDNYEVIAVCRSASKELSATDASVIEGIDVNDAASISKLQKELGDTALDVLINNAGILRTESLDDMNFETMQEQLEVNAVAPVRVTVGLMNNLSKGSKIGLVTSRMGSIDDNSSGGRYGYRMSKAALNAAGKSLAIDLKEKGIAVAILHPGFVQTDMVGGSGDISPDTAAKRLKQRIDELSLATTGTFWHSNGEELPW